ncbi:MAG TPA: hypothetical protein VKT77_06860, partial [Chthonomonadaceae bacterium]|nr:hypothetical protein [Chthonomonadaceae bacterium]
NVAVLPGPNGQVYVYVYPAQTDAKRWPLGGDTRFLVSADGAKIVATRRLHKSILEFDPSQGGATPAAGYHTAILDDLPEDTDVLYVLSRRPSIAEYILTPKFGYVILPNGAILSLGTRADAEKKMKAQ